MVNNKYKKAEAADVTVLPYQDFLRLEYMARDVADLVNPNLVWDAILPHQSVTAKSITYYQDLYSHMTDPLKRTPPLRGTLGEFATMKISSIERKSAALTGWGAQIEFDEDVQVYEDKLDDVVRTKARVAWWLAEFLNNWVISDMTNAWSTTFTSDATITGAIERDTDAGYEDTLGHIVINHNNTTYGWNDAAADPVLDIIDWKEAFEEQEPSTGQRYGYRLTDVYLDTPEYYDFYKYLITIDADWQKDPTGGAGIVVPTIGDVTIHQLRAAMYDTDGTKMTGYGFLFDRGNKPATIYEAFNPQFGRAGHFNVHRYMRDEDHALYFQFWTSRVTVVKEPKAFGMVYNIT